MNKLTLILLTLLFFTFGLYNCNNEETPGAPTITSGQSAVAGDEGEMIDVVINWTAGAGVKNISVDSDHASVPGSLSGTTGSFTSTITVQADDETITYTLTDKNNVAVTVTVDVTVGEPAARTITLEEPGDKSGLASFDGYDAGTKTYKMLEKNTYILNGFVYVNKDQTLEIEAGTVIKGLPGQAGDASALIITRGGKIMAEGTADNPIIFTGQADDLNGSVPDDANSLWGGVIILGKATNNNNDSGGEKSIEGLPTDDDRNLYGGNDDGDNSGVFKYVSIRHGGSVIGPDNEINGLTLGSVGSGTTIDHVEVFSNFDDGVEFFGGAVNITNWVSAWVGDDGLDLDEGFHGSIQNALVWTRAESMESDDPRGCELDGGVGANEAEKPYATAVMANITLFYEGGGSAQSTDTWIMRDNFGGSFINSIFYGYDSPIDIERRTDKISATDGPGSSYDRWVAGDIKIKKNVFYDIMTVTSGTSFDNIFVLSDETDAVKEAEVETSLEADNKIADPGFGSGSMMFTPSTDAATADLYTNLSDLNSGLSDKNYKGAVDPAASQPFFAGWSHTWEIINN